MTRVGAKTSAPGGDGRWLFGPAWDLALGCGLLYTAFFVAEIVAGPPMRTWLPATLLPFLTLALGSPHYGATLLRVHSSRADREHHFTFAVWLSLIVLTAFVVGLHVPFVGSLLLTLYLSWSPWHYSGQNYGVAVLLLRRGGGDVAPRARRMLRGSFVLSYLFFLLSLHGSGGTVAAYDGSIYSLLSLGIPTDVRDALMVVLLVAYVACVAGALVHWLRAGALRAAGPTLVLVFVQAIWFLLPASVVLWSGLAQVEPFAPKYRAYAFMWVAAGHFVQYLWIATYYAGAHASRSERSTYLGKALLAGAAIWTAPVLIFAPGVLGSLPYDVGLGLLAAACVNLHHFVLDGVIWRLRDDRVARILLGPRVRRDPAAPDPTPADRLPGWASRIGWTLSGIVLSISFLASWETFAGNRAADRGDFERFETSAARRAWLGRDSADLRLLFGVRAMQAGDLERAQHEADLGLRLHPTPDLWRLEGELAEARGDPDRALDAFESAIALDPESAPALYQSGRILAERGRLDEALARLERANAIWPQHPPIVQLLSELRARNAPALHP